MNKTVKINLRKHTTRRNHLHMTIALSVQAEYQRRDQQAEWADFLSGNTDHFDVTR
jgi:hypothetical protein